MWPFKRRKPTPALETMRLPQPIRPVSDMHKHEPADYELGFYVAPGYVPHSWGVFQHGKMLSTYTLKSNATRAANRLNGK